MKLILSWLQEFTKINLTAEALAERLSVSLTEVEKIERIEDEIVLEVENKALTHRPDCFSIEGIAREIAVLTNSKYQLLKIKSLKSGNHKFNFSVEVKDHNLCPRYTAVVISNLAIKPSPEFIQKRLRLSGVRPINNVVDITNYIMLQTGQPLHAFDYDKLSPDKKVIVRHAHKNEVIMTLDERPRKLDETMLVIADSEKAIAIAGLMGGANTQVSEDTNTIILESANFEHFNNRHTSLKLGLRTEASMRFEKGQDGEKTLRSLNMAAELFTEHAGGTVSSQTQDIYPIKSNGITISFSPEAIQKKLGAAISVKEIKLILISLGCKLDLKGKIWQASVPSYRKDLHFEADLVEEVARIYGYDRITPHLPVRNLYPADSSRITEFTYKVKTLLTKFGLDEIYTYTFCNPQWWSWCGLDLKSLLSLKNPLSPELSSIRDRLMPCLLDKVNLNSKNFDSFSFFEINKGISSELKNNLPLENKFLSGLFFSITDYQFFKLKGILEQMLKELGVDDFQITSDKDSQYFKKGESLTINSGSIKIGCFGNVKEEIIRNYGIKGFVSAFEFNFDQLFMVCPENKSYHILPKYPVLKFDLSFIVNTKFFTQEIINTLKTLDLKYLEQIEVFDVFIDKKFGSDKKSMAIRLTFSSNEKTLSDKEIKPFVAMIEKVLKDKFQAQIRKE